MIRFTAIVIASTSLALAAPASAHPFLSRESARQALHVAFTAYAQMTDGNLVISGCTHRASGHVWRTAVRCRITLHGGTSPAQYRGVVRMRGDNYFLTTRRLG